MLVLRLIMRTAHILAAAAWIGGSLMYLVVVIPGLRIGGASPEVFASVADLFRKLVNLCIGVLLLSGGFLIFDRLTQTTLGLPYLLVLGLKIALALGMFVLAGYVAQNRVRRLAKRTTRLSKVAPQLILLLGIIIFVLGALLNSLFEMTLAPH